MKTSTINLIAKIAAIVAGIGLILLSAFPADAASYPIEGQQYYLSGAGVTSSAVTIPLTALKTPDGRVMTMSMIGAIGYGTLEPQTTAKVENITFTGITQNGNGSASLTGVTRGLDFAFPYTASTTLRQSHSGGATFIITNTPNFYYDQFTMNNNNNLFTWPAASTSPASKGYVDFVAFNGAAVINANTTQKGVVQIGTGPQAALSTGTGSSGALLVIPTSVATSTYNAATAVNVIPVTNGTGKIDANFIPALATTTAIGAFPAYNIGKNIQVISTVGTTTFPIPSGVSKLFVEVQGAGGGGGGGNTSNNAASGGSAGGYGYEMVDVSATSSVQVFVGTAGAGGNAGATNGNPGQWSTFGTNGFYLSANGGVAGLTNGTSVLNSIGGTAAGGDVNIPGGPAGLTLFLTSSYALGGAGGSSQLGAGGSHTYQPSNGSQAGQSATGFGGGGGGAAVLGTGQNPVAGGNGTNGVVIIHW